MQGLAAVAAVCLKVYLAASEALAAAVVDRLVAVMLRHLLQFQAVDAQLLLRHQHRLL